MAANSEEIRKTIGEYIGFMNAADVESVVELYAEDAILEDPIGTAPIRGRAAIREFYSGAVAGNVTLEATGNPRVAAGQAAFPMRARLGDAHTIEIIDVMVFDDDGRISSMRAFWSTDGV
jgi:steroid delta-isomerase